MPEKKPIRTELKDEISQVIETEAAHAVSAAMNQSKIDIRQTIAVFLTIISMAVGMVLWATNSHAEIREWTSEQDFVTKKELTEVMKESYVKREEYVEVKQKLENLNEKHQLLIDTLDKIDRKIDRMYNQSR